MVAPSDVQKLLGFAHDFLHCHAKLRKAKQKAKYNALVKRRWAVLTCLVVDGIPAHRKIEDQYRALSALMEKAAPYAHGLIPLSDR